MLTSGVTPGTTQLLTVRVYDAANQPLTNAQVTLTRVAADGSTETLTALSGIDGVASFTVITLAQPAEYTAVADGVQSNSVFFAPITN